MLNHIKEVLNDKIKIDLIKTQTGSFLNFNEHSPQSKIQHVKIEDIPDNSIAFTLDYDDPNDRSFKKLSPYFNADNDIGINKSCDLVIFSLNEDNHDAENRILKVDIIVTDIKSDCVTSNAQTQVNNSILFINYILSLLNEYYFFEVKPIFFRRRISSKPRKSPIGTRGKKDQSETKIVSVTVKNKHCVVKYSRLIVQ
ncbi:hypothetical protein F164LOC_21410 [Pectobacterium carotovorum]|nr:hypothetical protein F164LOC_21410 [Pectobacterium carotovorum]